jgi:hypothetical protein
MDNNKLTKKRPIEYLNENIDLLEDLVLWPDVKYDIVEILDEVRNSYSDSLFKANESELTRNLYLSEKPNVFYMRELQRILNITGELIRKIDLEFKKYPDFIVEKYGREHSLHRYFLISIGKFKGFDFFAQNKIKEIYKILQEEKPKPPTTIKHPFNDEKTLNLFNHLVENWDYDKQQKWSDIWIEIDFSENYKPPYKNDYRKYIIERFRYTGKFQFDKLKKETNRDRINLIKHIKDFSKK